MTTTTTNDQLANLPIPAGATYVYAWADVEFGSPHRYFRGGSWVVNRDDSDTDLSVMVDGCQYSPDGRVARFIMVAEGDTD
jgi:hypothetical protein